MNFTANVRTGRIEQLGGKLVAKLTITTDVSLGGKINHILLLDVSGSMQGVIAQLKKDAKAFIQKLSVDEYVTVIIFSGHGQASIIAGPTATTEEGKGIVLALMEKHVRILGTTVFSEPLDRALETATSLPGFIHSTSLFTDGCAVPTKWSEVEERRKSLEVAAKLGKFGALLSTIGYGNWYDAKFLSELVDAAGGAGIERHVNEVEDFATVVASIRDIVRSTAFVDLELSAEAGGASIGAAIRVTPQVRRVDAQGKVTLRGLHKGTTDLYIELTSAKALYLTASVRGKKTELKVTTDMLSDAEATDFVRAQAAHAAATGDTGAAAEMLAQTGDDGLADLIGNAYSDREQREAGDMARQFFADRKFIGAGLKPTGPSHNILNILRSLIEDERNAVYLPSGAYKRGGVLTADPRIIHDPSSRSLRVVGYKSEASRLNFSMQTLKDVKVLPESGDGPATTMQIHRTYNVIRDGNLVINSLEASVTKETFDELQAAGCIATDQTYRANKVYTLDFKGIKLVSPVWAQPKNLGLVNLLLEEARLEAVQTALNARKKALGKPAGTGADDDSGIYREKAVVVEGVVSEFYSASCMQIELYDYKAPAEDVSHASTWEDADTQVKAVRQRLTTVRFLIRAITFAMHATKSRAISWGPLTAMPRTRTGKQQQLATFEGVQLRKIVWEEEIECS